MCAVRYDVVLFDLDGTLTESEPGILNCVQYAVEKMGFPVPPRAELYSVWADMRKLLVFHRTIAHMVSAMHRLSGWNLNFITEPRS